MLSVYRHRLRFLWDHVTASGGHNTVQARGLKVGTCLTACRAHECRSREHVTPSLSRATPAMELTEGWCSLVYGVGLHEAQWERVKTELFVDSVHLQSVVSCMSPRPLLTKASFGRAHAIYSNIYPHLTTTSCSPTLRTSISRGQQSELWLARQSHNKQQLNPRAKIPHRRVGKVYDTNSLARCLQRWRQVSLQTAADSRLLTSSATSL